MLTNSQPQDLPVEYRNNCNTTKKERITTTQSPTNRKYDKESRLVSIATLLAVLVRAPALSSIGFSCLFFQGLRNRMCPRSLRRRPQLAGRPLSSQRPDAFILRKRCRNINQCRVYHIPPVARVPSYSPASLYRLLPVAPRAGARTG
jgi:hypothetical protein